MPTEAPPALKKSLLLSLYRTMLLIRRCEEQLAQVAPARPDPRRLPHLRRPGGDRRRRLRPPAAGRRGLQHAPRPRPRPGQGRAAAATDRRAVRPGDRLLARPRRQHAPVRPRSRPDGHQRHRRAVHPPGGRAPATASSCSRRDRVAVAFFGDGAVNNGAFHEGLNLAGIWKLPVLFVCENNQFATEVPFAVRRPATPASPAGPPATACPASRSTATTSLAVYRGGRRGGRAAPAPAAGRRCSSARPTAPGPTPRAWAISRYRTREEVEEWKARCPIRAPAASCSLGAAGVPEQDLTAIDAEIERAGRRGASQFAEASPWPDPATATDACLRRRAAAPRRPATRAATPTGAREITFMQATLEALLGGDGARTRRSSSWAKASASAAATSRTTAGLYDLYGPERLCDTPICERGFVGLGCGAAMTGTRPVIDFMFADFVLDARRRDPQPDRQDAVHEQRPAQDADPAARLHRHRPLGGHAPLGQLLSDVRPLPRPARRRALDALRRQGPAARTPCAATIRCCSSNTASCWRSRGRCRRRITRSRSARRPWCARARDVTVVALALMVQQTLKACEMLAAEGISVELIDPRTVAPLDIETILRIGGQDGPAADRGRGVRPVRPRRGDRRPARRRGFDDLDAPIRRLNGAHTPTPYSPPLEAAVVPERGGDRPGDPRPGRGVRERSWRSRSPIPRLGWNMEEGVFVGWLKQDGDDGASRATRCSRWRARRPRKTSNVWTRAFCASRRTDRRRATRSPSAP